MPFLDEVHERVVIFDGAIGTNLHLREPTIDDYGGPEREGCVDVLSLTRPDFVQDLHSSFFEVGVDVVETNTFGAFATVLAEYDLQARALRDLLRGGRARDRRPQRLRRRRAAALGRRLDRTGHEAALARPRLASSRSATPTRCMARGLLAGGVDLLLIETCYDLLQAKAAVIGARRAMAAEGRRVPIQLQVTMETTGRMLVGSRDRRCTRRRSAR